MIANKNNPAKYVISALDKKHDKRCFKCGIDALDLYLKTQAGQDIKKNVAVTYVLTGQDSMKVMGFYTLSSIGIFTGELPSEVVQRLPRYPVLPGILLGRLARDEDAKGDNIGSHLLVDALKRSLAISNQIGIVAVIVDAKNEKAAAFYKSFGFIQFPEIERRLFLLLSTVKKLDL